MRGLGDEVITAGANFDPARAAAAGRAAERNLLLVPSFVRDVALGVPTSALEPFRMTPTPDFVYVPMGLGSGICSLIRTRDLLGLASEIFGLQAAGAKTYARAVAGSRVVTTECTATFGNARSATIPDQ